MPDNLLNFANDSLTRLDYSIHDKIESSFIDNFNYISFFHFSIYVFLGDCFKYFFDSQRSWC